MDINITKEAGHVTDSRTLDEVCAWLANGDYVVTIQTLEQWQKKQPRTLNQNALFYVWCSHIANFFNTTYGDSRWNKDNVHDLFCELFKQPEVLPDGRVVDKWVETHKLTKKQMRSFMEKIQEYMATEHGATVPLPDDDRYKDFINIY